MSNLLNAWTAASAAAAAKDPHRPVTVGRPTDADRVVWSLALTRAQRDKVRRMGGAKVVRAMIDAA